MATERFKYLLLDELTPEQRKVAERILESRKGLTVRTDSIGGPFNPLLRAPELCNRVQDVGDYIRFHGTIPNKLLELAVILTARRLNNAYEWCVHAGFALRDGLSRDICQAVLERRRPDRMDTDETIVYNFTAELLETWEVADASYVPCLDRFGERGVIELTTACGYFAMIGLVMNVTRVAAPPAAEADPLLRLTP